MFSRLGACPRARHPAERRYSERGWGGGHGVEARTEELIHGDDLQKQSRATHAGNGVRPVPFAAREQEPGPAARPDEVLREPQALGPAPPAGEDLCRDPCPLSPTAHASEGARKGATHVDEGDRDRGGERGVVVAAFGRAARGDEEVLRLRAERLGDPEGLFRGLLGHTVAREQEGLVHGGDAEQRGAQRLDRRVRPAHTVEQELEVSGQDRVLRRVGHYDAQRIVAVMTDLGGQNKTHSLISKVMRSMRRRPHQVSLLMRRELRRRRRALFRCVPWFWHGDGTHVGLDGVDGRQELRRRPLRLGRRAFRAAADLGAVLVGDDARQRRRLRLRVVVVLVLVLVVVCSSGIAVDVVRLTGIR